MPHVPKPDDTVDSLINRVLELEAALGSIEHLLERDSPAVDQPRRQELSDRQVALNVAKRMLLRRRVD